MPALIMLALVLRPLHWAVWVCKHCIHAYKSPAFLHLASLLPWGWLEHLVKTSASCILNIKLSTKYLHCYYTATATEKDVTTVQGIDQEHKSCKITEEEQAKFMNIWVEMLILCIKTLVLIYTVGYNMSARQFSDLLTKGERNPRSISIEQSRASTTTNWLYRRHTNQRMHTAAIIACYKVQYVYSHYRCFPLAANLRSITSPLCLVGVIRPASLVTCPAGKSCM